MTHIEGKQPQHHKERAGVEISLNFTLYTHVVTKATCKYMYKYIYISSLRVFN